MTERKESRDWRKSHDRSVIIGAIVGAGSFLLALPLFMGIMLGLLMRSGALKIETEKISPDGRYKVMVRAVDVGATGYGQKAVVSERGWLFWSSTTILLDKNLYFPDCFFESPQCEEYPEGYLDFVDNDTISIGGKLFEVSELLRRKR